MIRTTRKLTVLALTAMGLTFSCVAHAQLQINISGVGATQIPVAIAGFPGEDTAPQRITSIVKADLTRSGIFKLIDTSDSLSDASVINYDDWKKRGADALAVGSVQRLADGRFDVRYRLFDNINASQLSALSFGSQPQLIRLTAHKIADDIYQNLTGIPGIFSTRIAYVTRVGRDYQLQVADADGDGVQVALRSSEPIISPVWSPDGTKLAYVSFEARKPVIFTQNLITRERKLVANFKGSNSAPAWSPDGSRLAVALTRDGLTQIYIINADGSGLRRVTNSTGIDTEPRFSPDGNWLYFTSDRSGGPQIYKISINGGDAQRVTFNGSYNISPRISPDGTVLAYISRREGKFQLYTLDLNSGQELRLSDSSKDESPSFAPNGKYIIYATESSRRGALTVVSTDGRVKQSLSMQVGDVREPSWGPFLK